MLVLWIVGCAGTVRGPPLGDGPWNVTTAKGATLHIGSYYEGTLGSEWYEVVESSAPEDDRWLASDGTNNWSVTVNPDNQGPPSCPLPCTFLSVRRTAGIVVPNIQDARKAPVPNGSTLSERYHDAGEYDVLASVFPPGNSNGAPGEPVSVARMFVSEVAGGHQTEVLCVKQALRWAQRDDDFIGPTSRIDLTFSAFAALTSIPSKAKDCPAGYRDGYHRYVISVGQ